MPPVDSMLGLFGLATRRQLETAIDRKDRWHGLVRNVFIPYYLKFQQTAVGNMPDLPRRYSREWDEYVQQQLGEFLTLDLESVGDLLDAAGFGTDKWDKLQETGFPALGRLLDDVAEEGDVPSNGTVSDEAIDAAVNEDLMGLLSQHPDLLQEFARRLDAATGTLTPTHEDLQASRAYQDIIEQLEEARTELRRFRRGGQRALKRIHALEVELRSGSGSNNGHAVARPTRDPVDDERELAGLRKQLRARDSTIGALRGRIEDLEKSTYEKRNPDQILADRVAWLERELESRDEQVVRQQARIESLQDEIDRPPDPADESEELRSLRAELKAAEHELERARQDLPATTDAYQDTEADSTGSLLPAFGEDEDPDADDARAPLPGAGADDSDVQDLLNELKAKNHTIATLREQIERLEAGAGSGGLPRRDDEPDDSEPARAATMPSAPLEEGGELQQLRADLKARDHSIEGLREQIARLETNLEQQARRLQTSDEAGSDGAASSSQGPDRPASTGTDLQDQVDALERDLRAKESTITSLREQLERFEKELGQARVRLMEEVHKLSALAAGEIELKPSSELEALGADELLDYARNVAEDLDVRRQTLEEGMQGVESVKGSYEETRAVFEQQQESMESQLDQLRAEVETYRSQDAHDDDEESMAGLRHTIVKQRNQLELLSTRVRQLVSTNKDLNESNKQMYEKLEESVKRLIPLRRQIEESTNLQEALQSFIRRKYDRMFTMKKLNEKD